MGKTFAQIGMVQHLSRKLLPLSISIALLIAVLAPVTYWIFEHRHLQHMASLYAEELAEKFRHVALESSTLWKYQTYDFMAIAEGVHASIDVDSFRILDEKGEPISGFEYKSDWLKHGGKFTFTEEFGFTRGSAPIIFNNRRIGTVEVLACDTPLQRTTALLFFFSSLFGTALAVLVYRFPVRVVRKMEGEIEGLVSSVEESEERYRSLVEESLVGVYIIVGGIFKYVNPKMTEIFGWTREEMTGKKGPVDLTLPEDWPIVEENLRKRFSGEISSINYEFRGVIKDKRVIFLEVFGCRTIYQGQAAVIGTLLDISERKRAEEALASATEFARIVMDSTDDAISIVDVSDYRIMGCNAGFLKKFGLTRAEVVGRRCYELTHHQSEPCSPPFDLCPLLETVTTGNSAVAEHIHFQKNGDKFFAEVSTSPIFDGNGKVVRVVHVARDITERKHAEEKIRRLNEELEFKVEEKTRELLDAQEELIRNEKLAILGQIATAMANELRNPLGVMSNAIFFLKSVHADADKMVGEYLEIIKDEIDSSQRIVSDLLDFSGPNSPQAELIVFDQFIAKWLEQCAIPENIRLEIDLPETTPIMIQVDTKQLAEALHNLVVNAIQAMPDGGRLRVAARQVSSYGLGDSEPETRDQKQKTDFLAIFITDSGTGIAPENMAKLFQPLFTTKARGIGLGLAISQKRIEANGGQIGVESALGKGSTFVVTLPMLNASHAQREAP